MSVLWTMIFYKWNIQMIKILIVNRNFLSLHVLVMCWLTEPVVGVCWNDETNFGAFFKTHWNARNT